MIFYRKACRLPVPHKNTIEKIAESLQVPVSYLLFFSLSQEDVPKVKRKIFNSLNDALRSLLIDKINEKE